MMLLPQVMLVLLMLFSVGKSQGPGAAKLSAEDFVVQVEAEYLEASHAYSDASWAYATNITEENRLAVQEQSKISANMSLRHGQQAREYDLDEIVDPYVRRKMGWTAIIGSALLDTDKFDRVPAELEYYWVKWRDATGKNMRENYKEKIDLLNEVARLNGFPDATQYKLRGYESPNFVQDMATAWEGLKPLYQQLHAYVRAKLIEIYGDVANKSDGTIPAHLTGNMWAQSWINMEGLLRPYPEASTINLKEKMEDLGWTALTLFEKANDFFISMGFEPMTEIFWNKSMLEKPTDGRKVVCHASAWDFLREDDYRIKMCATVTENDFYTAQHEMGHIQYYMNYKDQSAFFRDGANSGFHEGMADILTLPAGTASYLKRLQLYPDDFDEDNAEVEINGLFRMALEKLVFMPFGYLVDKYRWDLYSNITGKNQMNCHWVDLRLDIQGISPPLQRDETDFDPGAKYHVARGVGYIRYFAAHHYQFQFYRAMCIEAGLYNPDNPSEKPLHKCDLFGEVGAGDLLRSMLAMGSSEPWTEAMRTITGQTEMRAEPFREYFQPLENWLSDENDRMGNRVGWEVTDYQQYCKGSRSEGTDKPPQSPPTESRAGTIRHHFMTPWIVALTVALKIGKSSQILPPILI